MTLSTTPDTYLQHSQGHGESEQLTSSPKGPDCGWTQAARFPKPSPPHQAVSTRGRSQHGAQMLGETWEGSAPGSRLSPQPLLAQQPPGPHTQALSQGPVSRLRGKVGESRAAAEGSMGLGKCSRGKAWEETRTG